MEVVYICVKVEEMESMALRVVWKIAILHLHRREFQYVHGYNNGNILED